jgi:hypothetical protein
MGMAMAAIFLYLQLVGSAAFIFIGAVIFTFTALTNKLNNISGHDMSLKKL